MNAVLTYLAFFAGMIAGAIMASDISSSWRMLIFCLALFAVAMIADVGRAIDRLRRKEQAYRDLDYKNPG